MNTSTRILGVGACVAAAATLCVAAPASATPHPHLTPTSLTLTATRGDTPPKHKVALTATLKAGRSRLADQTLYLETRSKTAHEWSAPDAITPNTDSDGHVEIPVTPGSHKGPKTQYRVVFPGDSTYKDSHSAVITVTPSS